MLEKNSSGEVNVVECNSNSELTSGVQTTSGTFTKAASASWSTSTNGVPNNWTIVNYTS